MLKPIDLAVCLKLVGSEEEVTYLQLATELKLSTSQVHRSVKAGQMSGLLLPNSKRVNRRALAEFAKCGARYAYPAVLGPERRGIATAYSAAPLNLEIVSDGGAVVWEYPDGNLRGQSLEPLYRYAPGAALADPIFYELLSLVDAIRIGRTRERKLAGDLLDARLLKE